MDGASCPVSRPPSPVEEPTTRAEQGPTLELPDSWLAESASIPDPSPLAERKLKQHERKHARKAGKKPGQKELRSTRLKTFFRDQASDEAADQRTHAQDAKPETKPDANSARKRSRSGERAPRTSWTSFPAQGPSRSRSAPRSFPQPLVSSRSFAPQPTPTVGSRPGQRELHSVQWMRTSAAAGFDPSIIRQPPRQVLRPEPRPEPPPQPTPALEAAAAIEPVIAIE